MESGIYLSVLSYIYLFYIICVFITNAWNFFLLHLFFQASWASHTEGTCWVCGEAEGFGHWYNPAALHGVKKHWKIVDSKSDQIQWHAWNKKRLDVFAFHI